MVMTSRATAPIEGKRLAAKAERGDREQIIAGELGGGVAIDAELEIGAGHALAVVGDADQTAAAAVGEHVDAGRTGVERVLDQLLDDARRALDHLAGGDAVDDRFGQLADGHDFLRGRSRKHPTSVARLIRIRPDSNSATGRPRGRPPGFARYPRLSSRPSEHSDRRFAPSEHRLRERGPGPSNPCGREIEIPGSWVPAFAGTTAERLSQNSAARCGGA